MRPYELKPISALKVSNDYFPFKVSLKKEQNTHHSFLCYR